MSEAQLVVSEAILGCSMNLMQAIKGAGFELSITIPN